MKDKGLDKGLIQTLDTSARSRRGQEKGFFGFRKMFWDYLNKLHVPFYDECCIPANGSEDPVVLLPVRYNADSDVLERWDPEFESWVEFDTTPDTFTTDTIVESTLDAGVTIEDVLVRDGGITSGTMVAAFYPQAAQNDIAAGTGGAISVANYLTTINTDAGGDAFTLADGTVTGQMKKILLVADGGGDGVVTPATAFAGGTTATFNDAGDFLIIQWSGTAWVILENSGVTVA